MKILLALFTILLLPQIASAKDTLIIGTSGYPPFTIVDKEKTLATGIDIDIIEEIAKRMNLKIVFRITPWKRCLINGKMGTVDIISSLLKKPEREEYMLYFDRPYKLKTAKCFYFRKGEGNLIQRYEDR